MTALCQSFVSPLSVLTWTMFVSKPDVEDVDARLVRGVVDLVLPVLDLGGDDVRAMGTFQTHGQSAVACHRSRHTQLDLPSE